MARCNWRGFAAAVAGRLGVTPPSDDGHPLAGMQPTARIDAESESPHDPDEDSTALEKTGRAQIGVRWPDAPADSGVSIEQQWFFG